MHQTDPFAIRLSERREKLVAPRRGERQNAVKINVDGFAFFHAGQLRLQGRERFPSCLPRDKRRAEFFEFNRHGFVMPFLQSRRSRTK